MSLAVVSRHQPSLRQAYGRARLAEIERMRQVFLASRDGVPQRDIARAVHLSQASVHRIVAKANALGVEHESLEEIVLRRLVGDLTSDAMLERLVTFERWVPRVVDPVDGVLAEDSRSELEALWEDSLISDEELDRVLDAHE